MAMAGQVNSAHGSNTGLKESLNKHQEKIVDDTDPNLDYTRTDMYRQSISAHNRFGNRRSQSKLRRSQKVIDQEYLTKIDEIEDENKTLKKQMDIQRAEMAEEQQKYLMACKEIEILQARISELELVHLNQENASIEKYKQYEYELELKENNIQALKDQQGAKQAEFRDKMHKLEEELELERENGIQLEKVTNQKNHYQKMISGLQEGMEQFQE